MKLCGAVVVLIAVACCLALSASARQTTPWHALEGYNFEAYVKEFGKTYASLEERETRRAVFETRLAEIRVHNADETKTWKEGVNHLTDRTEDEFKQMLGLRSTFGQFSNNKKVFAPLPESLLNVDISTLPDRVDWREKNVVTPVKDQGQCGSCWTFATAETVESHWALKTGQLAILSEQQILDCTPNPDQCGGTGGCQGGTAELAMARIVEMGGLSSEWTYSYRSYWGKNYGCSFNATLTPPAAKISYFTKLPSNQEAPLLAASAMLGPIAISVDASAWSKYESGVFNGCNQTNPDIDHAVQLVGYGVDEKHGPYYLVRNSWSPTWGESGYIRLSRPAKIECGIDLNPSDGTGCKGGPPSVQVCGTCGILYDNSFPLLF